MCQRERLYSAVNAHFAYPYDALYDRYVHLRYAHATGKQKERSRDRKQ